MSFQHNAFQQNAFQVQVGEAVGEDGPYKALMGVGLGIRLLAASQLTDALERRKLAKVFIAMLLPGKK